MTLPLELGGNMDPQVRRALEQLSQQFPVVAAGGGGGGGAPSGPAGGVLGGTYPNPSFAADMATQAELDTHTALTTGAHGGIVASTDTRLTDARAPTAHKATHEPGGTDAMTVDAAAATGSLRTLGTGATQALPGNHASTTNARTPTAHKTSHETGGSDVLTGNLDAVGRTNVKKAGATIGTRRGLNLIEGANVTLTVADDAANEEVDVTIAAAAGGGGGSQVGAFHAYRSTAQASLASGGTIIWNAEEFDVSGWHNVTTGRYTPLTAGIYRFSWQVQISTALTVDNWFLTALQKNGSATDQREGMLAFQRGAVGLRSTGTCIMQMNGTTDFVSIAVLNQGAVAVTVVAGKGLARFEGELVG